MYYRPELEKSSVAKCLGVKMSGVAKCLGCKMSGCQNVLIWGSTMSGWQNVLLSKCLGVKKGVSKCPGVEMTGAEMSENPILSNLILN